MTSSPRTRLVSIPALAAAFRRAGDFAPHAGLDSLLHPAQADALGFCTTDEPGLVPMYRISPGSPEPAAEAAAAAQVVVLIADRLRRLTSAYGEWVEFDAQAYFDLSEAQTACLLDLTERVTSVHLSFFVDALLPSFQAAAGYWEQCFQPDYLETRHNLTERFFTEIQPAMIAHWQRLLIVAHHTRRLLADDPAFWALNAANDERLRRRWAWRERPAAGIGMALLPKLTDVPTLTLSIDFPLPAYRQPGRLRRLRRSRAHLSRPRNS